MKYILRPKQQEVVNKIEDYITNSKKNHAVFVMPTSFGKSIVVANIASKFPNKYFINITTSKELLKQNYDKYTSYGFEAEICSASLNSKNVGKVTFGTISTIIKQIDYYKDKELVILFDECHLHSSTESQLNLFLKKVKNYKLVGITATPFRLSQGMEGTSLKMLNRDKKCLYKSIEDVIQIKEMVDNNYWSPLVYENKVVDETELKLNQSGTEYTDESIKKFKEVNDINNKVIEEVKSLIKSGRKSILISVPFIVDAQDIASKLDDCEAVYSGMNDKDRDRIIDDFKSLKLKVVIQCSILSVGFDHPELDALIMARPTNSLTFYYQIIGRLVRIHPNKKDGLIVDLSGNYNRFGRIEELTIENNELTKGWSVFSGDTLLSNYPLNTNNRPTRQSLLQKLNWEKNIKDKTLDVKEIDIVFYFGKYKNKKVSEVMKENKSYLTWLLDQKDFNWFGENGKKLKQSIQRHLGVFIEDVEPPKKTIGKFENSKTLIQNYTSNIKSITDLNNLW
jgi:DNA repair protein RadD